MPRVFAALLLPHDVCDALARDAKAFARIDPLARFTRSTNLHLTLAFVGEISTIDARRLSAALRPLCALTPRDITIGRIGTFDRQRILYAGLSPAESLDPRRQRSQEYHHPTRPSARRQALQSPHHACPRLAPRPSAHDASRPHSPALRPRSDGNRQGSTHGHDPLPSGPLRNSHRRETFRIAESLPSFLVQ